MSDADPSDDITDRLDGIPWNYLLLAGAGAFVAGYLLTVLVVVVGPSSVSGDPVQILVLLGFLFYSAHNVPVEVSGVGTLDWLAQAAGPATPDPAVPVVVFYAIPILVVVVTSFVASRRFVDRATDPVRIVGAVLAFTLTYWILAVAGTFVFRSQSIFGGPARLVVLDTMVFGLAYPLAFGAIGAGIAGIAATVRDSSLQAAG